MLTIEILQMIIPELTILSIGNAGVKINEKVIRIIIIPPPQKALFFLYATNHHSTLLPVIMCDVNKGYIPCLIN